MTRPACPKCQKVCDSPVAGVNAFPEEAGMHGHAWHVCWECEIASPTTPLWVSITAKPKTKKSKKIDWKRNTEYHWQAFIGGEVLDYWPTRKKWRFRGVTKTGDVEKFVRGLR